MFMSFILITTNFIKQFILPLYCLLFTTKQYIISNLTLSIIF